MSSPRGRLVCSLAVVWLMVPAVLAAARWPRWWSWIAPESTPMTWLQSVVLVLAAAGSLMVAYVLRRATTAPALPWWLLAGGFSLLAMDERFSVHERVRDSILAPRGITMPFLPWVAPGDFLLMGVAVAGLVFLPMVWRAMTPAPLARRALLAGVLLALLAVGIDSIDPSTWSVGGERLQQSFEEVVELGSGLALLTSVLCRLLGLLDGHLQPVSRGEPAGSTPKLTAEVP